MNPQKKGKLTFALRGLAGMFVQVSYFIGAYFGIFVLLELRKHAEQISAYRVVRYALGFASAVIILRTIVVAEVLTRHTGFYFAVFDYEVVMCLTGATIGFRAESNLTLKSSLGVDSARNGCFGQNCASSLSIWDNSAKPICASTSTQTQFEP